MAQRLIGLTFLVTVSFAVPSSTLAQDPVTPASSSPSQCIAMVVPAVRGVDGDATAVGSSVRELFASFLRGPSMQVVLLEARLASHAVDESREKQCPHVLTMTVTRKASGSGGGLLGKVVGQAGSSVVWGLPMGGVGGAVARGATTAATQAISEMASSTKARDEVQLDYKLTSLDGKPELGPRSDRAKAKADGEDLLTPMAERAAEALVSVVK